MILMYNAFPLPNIGQTMDHNKLQKEFTITNRLGLHARPASLLTKTSSSFESTITLTNLASGDSCDTKSVMSLLVLGVPCGSRVRLDICGPDAEQAMDALSDLILRGFDDDSAD